MVGKENHLVKNTTLQQKQQSDINVQECDATMNDSSTTAGYNIFLLQYQQLLPSSA